MKPHILRKFSGRCWAVRYEERRKPFHKIERWSGVGHFNELAGEWSYILANLAGASLPAEPKASP